MTSYSVRLYSGRSDELRNRYIECDRKEMPVMLARFVLDYSDTRKDLQKINYAIHL